jgi:hypothetical protein
VGLNEKTEKSKIKSTRKRAEKNIVRPWARPLQK